MQSQTPCCPWTKLSWFLPLILLAILGGLLFRPTGNVLAQPPKNAKGSAQQEEGKETAKVPVGRGGIPNAKLNANSKGKKMEEPEYNKLTPEERCPRVFPCEPNALFSSVRPERRTEEKRGGWGGVLAEEPWPRRRKADRRPKRKSLACSGPNAASWRADLNRPTAGAGWLTCDSNTRIDGACRFAYTNDVVRTCCPSD